MWVIFQTQQTQIILCQMLNIYMYLYVLLRISNKTAHEGTEMHKNVLIDLYICANHNPVTNRELSFFSSNFGYILDEHSWLT